MALNAKLRVYFDDQVKAGKMTQEYADKAATAVGDLPDDFQSGWLARQDYDRNIQDHKKNVEAFDKEKADWKKWDATARPEYDRMKTEHAAAVARIAELEAARSGNISMTADEELKKQIASIEANIEKKLKDSGYVPRNEVEKMLEEKSREAIGFMGTFVDQQREMEVQFKQKLGREMMPADHRELITVANEQAKLKGHHVSLDEAFGIKFGEEAKKIETDRLREQITKEVEARLGVPGAGSGGGPMGGGAEKGILQIRLDQLKGKEFTPGDGDILAAKASAVDLLRGVTP